MPNIGIDKIKIKNFKVFGEEEIIDIGGQHLLLFGENGSGKSSIYWALYTLLQASEKSPEKIQKYFDRGDKQHLLNIFTQDDISHIQISLTDEPDVWYKVSHDGIEAEGESEKQDVLSNLNISSDFITQRLLINFYNFRNSSEIDLWPVFKRDIIAFLKSDKGQGEKSLLNQYKDILLNKPFTRIKDGTIENRKIEKDYIDQIDQFNEDLKYWLDTINLDVNEYYQDNFTHNDPFATNISLTLEQDLSYGPYIQERKIEDHTYTYESKDINELNEPFIKLKIEISPQGKKAIPVDRPQSYLNEARLTAIALSVRFVLLKDYIRPQFDGRFLVLDDLLVSLDMNNRDIVTKIILDKFADDYQILLFTHDRSYFTWVKHELENRDELKDNGNWIIKEMYAEEAKNPTILDYEGELSTAHRHLQKHDYPAAANYLRKYAEKILTAWLPPSCYRDIESVEHSHRSIPLRNIVDNGILFLNQINQDSRFYKELRRYIAILLNPLSHTDNGVSRYKEEINKIIQLLKAIEAFQVKIKWSISIRKGELFQLRLPVNGNLHIYEIESLQELYSIEIEGSSQLSTCNSKSLNCFPISRQGETGDKKACNYYNNEDITSIFTKLCVRESIVAGTNLRPFLFTQKGKKI